MLILQFLIKRLKNKCKKVIINLFKQIGVYSKLNNEYNNLKPSNNEEIVRLLKKY